MSFEDLLPGRTLCPTTRHRGPGSEIPSDVPTMSPGTDTWPIVEFSGTGFAVGFLHEMIPGSKASWTDS